MRSSFIVSLSSNGHFSLVNGNVFSVSPSSANKVIGVFNGNLIRVYWNAALDVNLSRNDLKSSPDCAISFFALAQNDKLINSTIGVLTHSHKFFSTKISIEMRYYDLKRKERDYSIIVNTVLLTNYI